MYGLIARGIDILDDVLMLRCVVDGALPPIEDAVDGARATEASSVGTYRRSNSGEGGDISSDRISEESSKGLLNCCDRPSSVARGRAPIEVRSDDAVDTGEGSRLKGSRENSSLKTFDIGGTSGTEFLRGRDRGGLGGEFGDERW